MRSRAFRSSCYARICRTSSARIAARSGIPRRSGNRRSSLLVTLYYQLQDPLYRAGVSRPRWRGTWRGVLYFALMGRASSWYCLPEEEFAVTGGQHGHPEREGYGTTKVDSHIMMEPRRSQDRLLTPNAIVEQRDLSHIKVGVFDVDGILRGKCMSRAKFISALRTAASAFCDVGARLGLPGPALRHT